MSHVTGTSDDDDASIRISSLSSFLSTDCNAYVSAGLLSEDDAAELRTAASSLRVFLCEEEEDRYDAVLDDEKDASSPLSAKVLGRALSSLVSNPTLTLTLCAGSASPLPLSSVPDLLRHVSASSASSFVRGTAMRCSARSFASSIEKETKSSASLLTSLLKSLSDVLSSSSSSPLIGASLCAVRILLTESLSAWVRGTVIGHRSILPCIVSLLRPRASQQTLYDATFVLWAASFDPRSRASCFGPTDAVARIVTRCLTGKDKVVRVGLAVLCNLLSSRSVESVDNDDSTDFNERMIDAGVLPLLAEISVRQWSNAERDAEEANKDLKSLTNELQRHVRLLSSFERYALELRSGKLKRGFLHSEQFWSENARRFEHDNFGLIKDLVALLGGEATSGGGDGAAKLDGLALADPTTIAVACYDLGEFARFYDSGKTVLGRLSGKSKLLRLVDHPNEEVQREALQASAKLLIDNWEHVGA